VAPIIAGVLVAAAFALLGLVAYSVWSRGEDREAEWRTFAGRYVDAARNEALVLESKGQWQYAAVGETRSSGSREELRWDVYDASGVPDSLGYQLRGKDAALFVPQRKRGDRVRGWYFAIEDRGRTLARLNNPGDPTTMSARFVRQPG
jgi:hypothetical protein